MLQDSDLHIQHTMHLDSSRMMNSRLHSWFHNVHHCDAPWFGRYSTQMQEGANLQRPAAQQLVCRGALQQCWLAPHQHSRHPLPPPQQAHQLIVLQFAPPALGPGSSSMVSRYHLHTTQAGHAGPCGPMFHCICEKFGQNISCLSPVELCNAMRLDRACYATADQGITHRQPASCHT